MQCKNKCDVFLISPHSHTGLSMIFFWKRWYLSEQFNRMQAWYWTRKVVRWWFGNVVVEFMFKGFNRWGVHSIVWKSVPNARGWRSIVGILQWLSECSSHYANYIDLYGTSEERYSGAKELTFCLPTGHFWATSSTPLSANGPLLGHLFGFYFWENSTAIYILVVFNVKKILFQQNIFGRDSFHEMH